MFKNKGFTLLEILIVVGIAAGIFAFSSPFALKFYYNQQINEVQSNIMDALQRARHNAVLQKNDSAFGVTLNEVAGSMVLYQGADYASRDETLDEVIPFGDMEITGLTDVTFSKLTGLPNVTGTINIVHGNLSRGILIDTSGILSKTDVIIPATPAYAVVYRGSSNTSGTVPVDASTYALGDTVTVLDNTGELTRTGYIFSGWKSLANGTTTYFEVGSTFTMTSINVTLYANWTAQTVTYDANGGAGSPPVDLTQYPDGNTVTVKSQGSLTRTGYTFVGWNTTADYSGTNYTVGSTFVMGESDVTLYAKWVNYIVSYNGNTNTGGSVPTDANHYMIGATVTVLDNTGPLTKNGYTFIGWSTASDCTGTNRNAGSTFTMGSADVVLYARWISDSTDYVWVTNTNSNSITKLNGSACPVDTYNVGHNPRGLAVDIDGNIWVTNINSNNVIKLNGSTGATIGTYNVGSRPYGVVVDASGNIWVANRSSNNVTKLNGSTGATIGTYTVGTTPYGVAADASGNVWVTNSSSNNVTRLNVSTGGTIGTYSVGAAPKGAAVDASGNVWVTNGNSSVVKKLNGSTGATIGTYNVGSRPYGVAVDASGNVWVANQDSNNVTKLNGSTGATIGTYTVGTTPYGVAADASGNVWVTNSSSNNVTRLNVSTGGTIGTYSVGNGPMSLGDFTGYALKHFVMGRVVYNGNGNTGGSAPTDSNNYTSTSTVTVLGNTGSLTKTGYTFSGWNTAADGSGTSYSANDAFAFGSANVILYAQYSINSYTVSYDGNGATGGSAPAATTTYQYGATVTALDNTGSFVRDGYTFNGWTTVSTCGTARAVNSTFAMGAGNVTLYANWVSPSTDYIWVTIYGQNNISKFNGSTCALAAYTVGTSPRSSAIDANGDIWVANYTSNNVSKVSSSTGAVLGTYSVGSGPTGIAVDASGNIWTANYNSSNVTKLNGSTGATIGTYTVGANPFSIAVGTSSTVWVTSDSPARAYKLNASTGAIIGSYTAGTNPRGIAIDASGNVWVANYGSSNVTKLNGSDGSLIGTYSVGTNPLGIAVDVSANVWVANTNSSNVTKLNGSTGAVIGTYNVGTTPRGIAADYSGNIWVVNYGSSSISKLNGSDGSLLATYSTNGGPYSMGDFTGFALHYFVLGER